MKNNYINQNLFYNYCLCVECVFTNYECIDSSLFLMQIHIYNKLKYNLKMQQLHFLNTLLGNQEEMFLNHQKKLIAPNWAT